MDKQMIERAVEAAAKADYEALYSNPDTRGPWEEQSEDFRDMWRNDVRPMVTAALAEVEGSIKAQALREAADWLDQEARTDGILEHDVEGLAAFQLRSRADLIEVGEYE